MEAELTPMEMQRLCERVKFGSILVIPLRYRTDRRGEGPQSLGEELPLETTDICEAIRNSLQQGREPLLRRHRLPKERLYEKIRAASHCDAMEETLYVCKTGEKLSPSEEQAFRLHSLEVYTFPHVAFFCLGISYRHIEQLCQILNPGYAVSQAEYHVCARGGEACAFSLDEAIAALCADFETEPFFRSGSSLFLEAYSYNEALFPERFRTLAVMKQLAYNLHTMESMDIVGIDEAEEDLHYVFSVKDSDIQTYRWGSCVSLQSVAFVAAAADMDIERELKERFTDELLPVILALYQKYTCIRLSEMQTELRTDRTGALRTLQRRMLQFKAFGVIYPDLLSRWDNVRRIYAHLFTLNGIESAVADIDNKVSVLIARQKEKQENTESAIAWVITVFGVLSIIESIMSLLKLYQGGTPTQHLILLLSSFTLMLILLMTILIQRRKWK